MKFHGVVTVLLGAFFVGTQAFALPITLNENFNEPSILAGITQAGLTQSKPLDSVLTQLNAPGISYTYTGGASNSNTNIRLTSNTLNSTLGGYGFNRFFPVTQPNGFLVIGDIGDSLNLSSGANSQGTTTVKVPFNFFFYTGVSTVTFDFVFNGYNTSNPLVSDIFTAYITDGTNRVTLLNYLTPSRVATAGGNLFAGNFAADVHNSVFITKQVSLVFTLIENVNTLTNSGVGLDNLKVTQTVPEPSTFLLLCAGLGGLALLRRKAKKQ